MSQVLTQQEIDELLSALQSQKSSSSERSRSTEEVKYKKYDFRLANKLTKEQMRSLESIYDSFTYLFNNYLTATLRMNCEAEMISIEEHKFAEFSNSLLSNALFAILGMEPLAGTSLLDLSPQIAFAMMNRVLGGSVETKGEERTNFTEIELVIMGKIIKQISSLLEEAWSKVVPFRVVLERLEVNPQFVQIVSSGETAAIVTINVKIGETEGLMHFCLPHISIKPIEKQLTLRTIYSGKIEKKESEQKNLKISQMLKDSRLDLVAKFNTTYTSFQDCLNLQPGDVLLLDHKVFAPLNLYLEHIPKFKGKLGAKDNKYAIYITQTDCKKEV